MKFFMGVCVVGVHPLCRRVLDESARALGGISGAPCQKATRQE
jgi:hypothetical protein